MPIKISKNLLIFSLAVSLMLPVVILAAFPSIEAYLAACKEQYDTDVSKCPSVGGAPPGERETCLNTATQRLKDCNDRARAAFSSTSSSPSGSNVPGGTSNTTAAPIQGGQISPTQGGVPSTGGGGELANPLGPGVTTFTQFVDKLFGALNEIIMILAVFFMILAGFQFLTAQGNDEKIKKAKQTLLWTVVGVAIAVGAKILITAIADILKTL